MTPLSELTTHPMFGISITLLVYGISLKIGRRFRSIHPVLFCSVILVAFLMLLRIPYEDYNIGGSWISLLLGPATVALAVPLYVHRERIFKAWKPIITGVLTGTACSLALNYALVILLGGDHELMLTMLAKSTTAPVSIELTRLLGGVPEMAAVFTVLTGIFGSMIAPWFLYRIGVRDDMSIGIAVGTAAHGIGTGRIIRDSEIQGAYSGMAMALTALIISLLCMPLNIWLALNGG